MKRKWVKVALIVVLILLPVVLYSTHWVSTNYHKEIVLAGGTEGGLYLKFMKSLKKEMEDNLGVIDGILGVKVHVLETSGSLENLVMISQGKADFCLYQPRTREALVNAPQLNDTAARLLELTTGTKTANVAFVANLYSQPVHFVVRKDAGIRKLEDLRGKTVAIGSEGSGDYAMSLMLLAFFGLGEPSSNIDYKHFNYGKIKQEFVNGDLDAAFITIGTEAPIFPELFETGQCDILPIPFRNALLKKHISMTKYTIPKALFVSEAPVAPDKPVKTVALGAQLLTRRGVPDRLANKVARLVQSERFMQENKLDELYAGGHAFAQEKREFEIHPGAQSFYDPEFDVQQFEGWEALYSLAASTAIAVYFALRTLKDRRRKHKEHRLDRFIHSLLDIELRQVGLDEEASADDIGQLQKLLDDVTDLRQDALREITANELNEDRAADSFIKMCHDLSNKINAKISRQRLDRRLDQMCAFLKKE